MKPALLLCLLPVFLAQDSPKYHGKYRKHSNISAFLQSVSSACEEARLQISKRLGVQVPGYNLELVDLDSPLEDFPFPPRGGLKRMGLRASEQEKEGSVYLQMDWFIGDPSQVKGALMREIARVSLFEASKDELARFAFRASNLGLIDGLASQFAGANESEIAYSLCYSVAKGEKLEDLVIGVEEAPPPKNIREHFKQEVKFNGRLTPQFCARYLASKGGGEKQFLPWVQASFRGQTLESIFKKATGKGLEDFNAALVGEYKNYIAKYLPKTDLELYKKIKDALDKRDFEPALKGVEEFLKKSPQSILAGNVLTLKGLAQAGLKKPEAEETFRFVLSQYRSKTPLAKEAQYQLGILALQSGNTAQAKIEFQRLRDDFGWDEQSLKRATEELGKVSQ